MFDVSTQEAKSPSYFVNISGHLFSFITVAMED